jgi:hypothetical protein
MTIDQDDPMFEITVHGTFRGKHLGDVMDVITDALHDWLNPDWKEGDDCVCEFVASGRPIDDPVEEDA